MQVFFATGYNKSGTTYLQQLLDAHPNANCPPEHHLNSVADNLQKFLKSYRRTIELFDERTAQQGLRHNDNRVFQSAMRGFINAFVTDGAMSGTSHFGLNDNSMWRNLGFFGSLFPEARFVGIVRDPRSVAVSLFHHRSRTEPEFKTSGMTLSKMAGPVGETWAMCMKSFHEFQTSPATTGRMHVVRYEDLAGENRQDALTKVYEFLNLPSDPKTVEDALDKNDFKKQQGKASSRGGFLRSGASSNWRDELSNVDLGILEKEAGAYLESYGYVSTQ